MKTLEKKINSSEYELTNKIKDIENRFEKEQQNRALREKIKKLECESEQLNCESCEFTTTSKKGMKTHQKKKHSETIQDKFPFTCELCEEELTNKLEFKKHMRTHTYKSENSQFKCVECTFIGENEWTMQIHNGKHHRNQIKCKLI